MLRTALAAATLVILAAPAHADEAKLDDKLSFGGRFFARTALVDTDADDADPDKVGDWDLQSQIASARVGATYRWERLRLDVELELTTQKLKDAVMRLRAYDANDTEIDVHAGQFKMPFSAIQLESGWRLPLADRGLVSNILTDRLQVAGRHIGVDVEAKFPGEMKPRAILGVFQGTDDAGDPLSTTAEEHFGQDVFVRGTIEPIDGVEIGAAVGERTGRLLTLPPAPAHRFAAEIDVTVHVPVGPGHARAWAEALAGGSWLREGDRDDGNDDDPIGPSNARFTGARALVAWRYGGTERSDWYLEPYGMFAVLDPDADFDNDRVIEATGGIGYGRWDVWRIQAEFEAWRIGANAPIGIYEPGAAPANTTAVMLQVGAHF